MSPRSSADPSLLILHDPKDEGWFSMDLSGEQLVRALQALPAPRPSLAQLCPSIPAVARRAFPQRPWAFNADRLLTRFGRYPLEVLKTRSAYDLFHVVDHSYGQLLHCLPAERSGVYVHDLDAFRSVLEPSREPRPAWYRAVMSTVLRGVQRAGLVFHSTQVIRDEILAHELVPPERLVAAPFGIEELWFSQPSDSPEAQRIFAALQGRPYVLHVGSSSPRKRLDMVFRVFARLREKIPELQLLQQGASLTDDQRSLVRELHLETALHQPPRLERSVVHALYARASLVVFPSSAEGFGFPVLEGLASGAQVLASALPVLREVGGPAAYYAPVGDLDAWVAQALALLLTPQTSEARTRAQLHARRFRWETHAQCIWNAYQRLVR